MSATTAVMIQIILASGIVGGVLLAFIAYVLGIGKAILAVAAVVFSALIALPILAVFWPAVLAIGYNTFFRKAPSIARHRAS